VRRRIEEDRNPPYIPEIGDSFHWDWDPTTYREYVVKEVIRDEHGYVTAIRAADSLRLQRSLMDFTYDHQKRRWFNVTYNNYMAAVDVWWKSPGDR
jgi:hypothetical protein